MSEEVLAQTTSRLRVLAASPAAIQVGDIKLSRPAQVNRFYLQREFQPVWVNQQGTLLEAAELLQVVERVEDEGLPVHDYPVAAIEQYLQSPINDPNQLAQLDLLLTDTFLLYSRNVRSGRVGPRKTGGSWLLPYASFDGSTLLTTALTDSSMSKALASLPPPHPAYRRLRSLLQHYRGIATQGGWPTLSPGETLRVGSHDPRVIQLRERLRLSGDYPRTAAEQSELFDPELSAALMRFQLRHGLEADGSAGRLTLAALNIPIEERIRQIEANMERWRWMPREMPSRYILVNMAGYELDVFESNASVMHMRVIVGRNYRQTPVFTSEVTNVVLNPHWYVPPLIFREDILPTLRKDPNRLERLKMRLLSNGNEVDSSNIDWSTVDGNNFPYTLRQEPGPINALGRIKFILPNIHGVYLHDTPDRHLFDRRVRAFSSGCIRLEQPLELGQYLLADPEQWDVAGLEEAIDTGTQRGLTLPEPVPIYFTYWTVWVDRAGELQFREDIYHRDRRLLKLWEKSAT